MLPRLLVLASLAIPAPLAVADTPLKVLFLGDRGHHRPAERYAQIEPVLATRGIHTAYTEALADLTPSRLAKYDALIVYANIDEITPEAERTLLDYVAGGGGFVPLHCASYCFRNSPACVDLIGAQFLRHGMGEFDVKVLDAEHPITKGLEPFHTWDETYVHTKHNTKDRHVLQTRAEGDGDEPWTWVRTHGKGRVFYTAYGHDARTWTQPGFHDLLERGIRWAAANGEVFDSRPRVASGLKPFDYATDAKIPFYVAGARAWGTQGEPINKMQKPLEPAESMKHMVVPKGFEVRLFAAEPEITKPIAMAWDHKGRLWIVESTDYPNNKLARGATGHDRIKICEDTDADGKADKFTVFADGLNIPTAIVCAGGGVIIHQAPDTILLKDTDGDDKADERKVLFTGWGTDDTHAGPSNLRYGLDNWIYGIVGYSAFRGTVAGETLRFGQGLYRFKPDGSKLEFLRSTNNNSWGVGISEEGLVFGSTANGCPSVFMPIPNRYYERVRGWSPSVLRNIADSNRFFPITDKVRQVDWHGGFTAGAGHALYTARTYPRPYWDRTAFVCEPTGHLVATFTLEPRGSDFAAHYGWNLLASDDEWVSPIVAEVGPDGQVWVIDWYNFIVQHNPTPRGFETGKGNAYVTPLRDRKHGRIYRIVYKDAQPESPPRLDPKDPRGLVAALQSDNQLWRLHAQRLLVERAKQDVAAELVRLVSDEQVDPTGLNAGAVHALWTLHGLGALDPKALPGSLALAKGIVHPSAAVRRNALLVLPASPTSTDLVGRATELVESDPQVLLAKLLALADLPDSAAAPDAAALLVLEALTSGRTRGDRWLSDAATTAAAAHDGPFLQALAKRRLNQAAAETIVPIARRVAEHMGRGAPVDSIAKLLAGLAEADPRITDAVVAGLARGWPRDRKATLDEASERAIAQLFARLGPEAKGQLANLAARLGSTALDRYTTEIAATLLATARDETKTETERVGAARQLVELRPGDPDTPRTLLELIAPRTPATLAAGLIDGAGRSESPQVGAALVEMLPALTPTVRSAAYRALLGRADWTTALLDGAEAGKLRLTDIALDQQQALAAHPDRALANRAKRLLDKGGGLPDPDRQKVIDALAPVALKGGDPARGQEVFKQQCAKCHTHNGEGGKVGPDLTGMAAHPREELLIHILDPGRSVEGNFIQYTLATRDGRVLNGLLASETKTAVELLDADGKSQVVLREDIEELAASKKSLMPEGFESQVKPEGVADLLAFLTQRGKYLPLDLRKVATAVSTRGMFYSPDGDVERLIFADWGPKTFDGIPFQLVDPRGDKAPNVVLLYGPLGQLPPRMPKSVSIPCNTPARAIHMLSGVSGWGYNGSPVEPTVSMIVRIRYADGTSEEHALRNGVEFADYIRHIDVPGSKYAFGLRGRQIRYLAVQPRRTAPIASLELVKGDDQTAPVVMAVTVETGEAQ
jgi:putative membrane-bound dehydrogenase-like protein